MKTWMLAIGAWLFSVFGINAQPQNRLNLPELNPQLEHYQSQLTTKATADRRTSFVLFRQVRDAMAQGKPALALNALEVLAGRKRGEGEGGAQTWIRLSLAWDTQRVSAPDDEPPGPAIIAAYGAYQRAQSNTDQVEALSLLGNLLIRLARIKESKSPDPDIEKPKEIDGAVRNFETARRLASQVFGKLAELAPGRHDKELAQTAPTPFFLDHLEYPPPPRAVQYGDRDRCPVDFNSDKAKADDETIPAERARCVDRQADYTCLVFSRSLDARQVEANVNRAIRVEREDRSGLVRVTPTLASIKADTVCYANLNFGAKYRFILDSTLRAADGSALVGPRIAYLAMPKRPPTLGFKRGAYVMPSVGSQTITLKTVNLSRATLMLHRIGDRSLIRDIVSKNLIRGTAPRDTCLLLTDISEKVAEGTLELGPPHVEEKVYDLAIGEILKARTSWLQGGYHPGTEGRYPSTEPSRREPNKLSLKLLGDPIARDLASDSRAGVFILLGKAQDDERTPSADSPEPDGKDDSKEKTKTCSDGLASQWFVITNIGLTLQRSQSTMYVIARDLETGAALSDVTIEFLSKNGTRLEAEQIKTKADGTAEVPAKLGRGTGGNALAAAMAYRGTDFAFLDVTSDSIDLAERGMDGTGKPGEYSAFIAPSRAIFRPGETIEALVLVRGADGKALKEMPAVEMRLSRSDGTLLKKPELIVPSDALVHDGGFAFKIEIPRTAAEGSLKLAAYLLGKEIGSYTVEVQFYRPLTVRLSVKDPNTDENLISASINQRNQLLLKGSAHANYFYGMTTGSGRSDGSGSLTDAPAAHLRGDLEARLEPARSPMPQCFQDFTFGYRADDAKAQIFRSPLAQSDNNGRIAIDVIPQDAVEVSDVPMQASLTMTLYDLNGRAAQGKFGIPVMRAGHRWIGVKAVPPSRPDANTKFEFVLLDDGNKPVHEPIWVTVYREQIDFVWSQDGNSWEYRPVPPERVQISRQSVKVTPPSSPQQGRCPGVSTFELPLHEPGRYIVRVTDERQPQESGHAVTELSVGHGFTTAPDGFIKPDTLRVWTQNKESFAPGEEVAVDIETPHEAGLVFGEVVIRGEVKHSFEVPIQRESNLKVGRASHRFTVDRTWPAGTMHIYATSFRRFSNDSLSGGPGRAIGGVAVQLGSGAAKPVLSIRLPTMRLASWDLHNGRPLRIPIVTEGLQNGWVALAIVNEGMLQLPADFKTPDPYAHFFSRRGINLDVFDNYGRILYGRYGADTPLAPLRGTGYLPDDIVAWHSGRDLIRLVNGRADVEVSVADLEKFFPRNFQGELRLMAWAWDAETAVHGENRITLRDGVVVQLSRPAFMAPGDAGLLPIRARNLDRESINSLALTVTVSDGLAFADNRQGASASSPCGGGGSPNCRRFDLAQVRARQAPGVAHIPIRALSDYASGKIAVTYRLGDEQVDKSWEIPIRPPSAHTIEIIPQPELAAGTQRDIRKLDLERIALSKYDVNSLRLSVRVSRSDWMSPVSDAVAEAEALQLEQLTGLLQLLLTADVPTTAPGTPERVALIERVNRLVVEIGALQNVGGGFAEAPDGPQSGKGVVPGRDSANVGASAFVLDVLARARSGGADVDETAIDRAAAYLTGEVRNITDRCSRQDVYALAVLARLNRISRTSFLAAGEACTKSAGSDATMKLLLAAAFGSYGLTEQAQALLNNAGLAALRKLADAPAESARVAALLLESGQGDPELILTKVALRTEPRTENLATASWLSRAFNAALGVIDASRPPFNPNSVSVTPSNLIERVTREGMQLRKVAYADWTDIRLANRGNAPLQLSYVVEAVPLKAQEEHVAGFRIRLNRLGVAADKAAEFKQFETAYFAVEINQSDSYAGPQRVAAVQLLPAGFEGVDNAYQQAWKPFIGEALNEDIVNRGDKRTQAYTEFQDDRWIALPRPPDRSDNQNAAPQAQLLAFSVRPTFPGEYVLPPLLVRDLNNPERIAWTKPQKVVVVPAN